MLLSVPAASAPLSCTSSLFAVMVQVLGWRHRGLRIVLRRLRHC